jgi:RNA-directed DNA polymerase
MWNFLRLSMEFRHSDFSQSSWLIQSQALEHRVADHRILRLIQKWLKAGVSEDGQWKETRVRTPQGAVASPLLANVYLHYVFDLWVEAWRKKVAKGDVIVVRYADDLVVGFENRAEAERFLKAFRERLAKFDLELNSEKTRLIEFGRFAAQDREQRGEGKPETFTFLGFTHYCGKRRSNGAFIVWRKTAKKRMVAKLHAIKAELRHRMHEPVASVGEWLQRVVVGYYRYHAVPGNLDRLRVFGQRLRRLWWLVLSRRSQRKVPWDRVTPIFACWIPVPRVLHPYPTERFLATHPRWEPYA